LYHNSDKAIKLKEQLLSYQALSQRPDTDRQRAFLLSSKQPISEKWKTWLDDNKIAYEEGTEHD